MTFHAFCLCQQNSASERARLLGYLLQRRRIVRERRARQWRLWTVVAGQSPCAGVA